MVVYGRGMTFINLIFSFFLLQWKTFSLLVSSSCESLGKTKVITNYRKIGTFAEQRGMGFGLLQVSRSIEPMIC